MGGVCKHNWLLRNALLKCEGKMILVYFPMNYSYGHRKHYGLIDLPSDRKHKANLDAPNIPTKIRQCGGKEEKKEIL